MAARAGLALLAAGLLRAAVALRPFARRLTLVTRIEVWRTRTPPGVSRPCTRADGVRPPADEGASTALRSPTRPRCQTGAVVSPSRFSPLREAALCPFRAGRMRIGRQLTPTRTRRRWRRLYVSTGQDAAVRHAALVQAPLPFCTATDVVVSRARP